MGRFSLAGALWFVAFVAFGFAAVRNASDFWVGATFLATLGLLCASVLGAVLERGRGGVWWLGFALFGWAHLVAGLVPGLANTARMPSDEVSRRIFVASNPAPNMTGGLGGLGMNSSSFQISGLDGRPIYPATVGGKSVGLPWPQYQQRLQNSTLIGHWLLILIFARLGATVSCLFTKGPPWRRRPEGVVAPAPVSSPTSDGPSATNPLALR